MKICNWTIGGAAGCATATSRRLGDPAGTAGPAASGGLDRCQLDVDAARLGGRLLGTGSYAGQVRVLVHTQRWTAPSPTPFSTWGNFMRLVYDAP